MKIISASLSLVLVMLFLAACNAEKKTSGAGQASSSPATKAVEAPPFTLPGVDGDGISLSSFRGKVVILDFWATWCPPCRREIPDFVQLQNQYGAQGLQIVGVSVDDGGWKVVNPFIADNGINYPVLMYDDKTYAAYQDLLSAEERGGIPFTFILDRQGQIRAHFVGYTDKATFEAALKPLLGS